MSQPALENNRPDLVPAHVLCSRCSRVTNKSTFIQLLLSGNHKQIEREKRMNNTTETFVHSRSVRDILSSASAGCHLCSIISTSQKIDPNNLDREDPQQGVIQAYLRSDSYKRDSDKGWFYYVYLSIEDVSWLRIPEEAAENYELLDGILHEQLPLPRHRWTRPIDDLKILPIKENDFMYFPFGPPETDFLPSSTKSPQTFNIVRHWMDDCLQNHPGCNQNIFTKGKGSSGHVKLPTRLIFVGEEADGQLAPRLVLPRASESTVEFRYLTLSHSWAITGKSIMLTIANTERFLQAIPLQDLSQTFYDALIITRELGFQYIWIDSLCIIQDSVEDWEKEALTMSDVYGHSSCNIAACGGFGIDGCFVSRNPLHHFPCRLRPHCQEPGGNGGSGSAYVLKDELLTRQWRVDRSAAPLLSRGWCVQERLLSPRVVYFGAEDAFWECCHSVVRESHPSKHWMKDFAWKDSSWASLKARFQELCVPQYSGGDIKPRSRGRELGWVPLDKVKTVEPSILRLYLCWYRIVSNYSFASLTKTTDRLMALAGIASAIEKSRGWTYVAGTWKEFWPLDLLWCFSSDQELRVASGIPAPSWSWAAKEGGESFLISVVFDSFAFNNDTVTYMSQVVDYFCPPTLSQHCSGVTTEEGEPGMTITLKGPVRRGVVGNGLGNFQLPSAYRVQLDDQYGSSDAVMVSWDETPRGGEPVLLLLVVTWEDYMISFQHVGLVLMPEPNQLATKGSLGVIYRRVGAWIAHRAETNPQSLFFHSTEAEETVRIC